ncbi:hypothetical protein [Leptothermofonsia sp. ETS-13]|uniref:hypothetical protein n=1 Tax=Leptothermofonsia sp. ETS-13 TaxID=3035696 RepID=UPI003BA0DD92
MIPNQVSQYFIDAELLSVCKETFDSEKFSEPRITVSTTQEAMSSKPASLYLTATILVKPGDR